MMSEKIKKLLKKDFSYPSTDDEDFQNKIYEKREFYYNRVEEPKVLTNYAELKKYRESICINNIKRLQPKPILYFLVILGRHILVPYHFE